MTAWTAVDQAELDVLLWELAGGTAHHRTNCHTCQRYAAREHGSHPCPHIQNAVAIVLDWYAARRLLTRAEQLRLDRHQLIAAVQEIAA